MENEVRLRKPQFFCTWCGKESRTPPKCWNKRCGSVEKLPIEAKARFKRNRELRHLKHEAVVSRSNIERMRAELRRAEAALGDLEARILALEAESV